MSIKKGFWGLLFTAAVCGTTISGCSGGGKADLARRAAPETVQKWTRSAAGDLNFNLRPLVNFTYEDRIDGDPTDGWSCWTHDMDQRNFAMKRGKFAGVEFDVINPQTEMVDGALIAMKSPRFARGAERVTFDLDGVELRGDGYLYLLHNMLAPEMVERRSLIGRIEVLAKDGRTQTIDIRSGNDIRQMHNADRPRNRRNTALGTFWRTTHSMICAFFVSRHKLDIPVEDIASISLVPAENVPGNPVWQVAGVTLSNTDHTLPKTVPVLMDDGMEGWDMMRQPEDFFIAKGSVLDFDRYLPEGKSGDLGVAMVGKNGDIVFEKDPDTPVRFISTADNNELLNGRDKVCDPQVDTPEKADRMAEEARRRGYNLVRLHGMDYLFGNSGTTGKIGEFNPATEDEVDRYIYALKQKGIYLSLDCAVDGRMYAGNIEDKFLDADGQKLYDFKSRIYFDPEVRQVWIDGTRRMLTHVNPYTGMALIDDPMLVILVGYNEQEYAFEDAFDLELAKPFFQDFLRRKYGTIDKLKTAWGARAAEFTDFADIPCFTQTEMRERSAYGIDCGLFIRETENNLQEFFKRELRAMGYKGLYCNFNVGKSFHYNAAHTNCDFVSTNTYHTHPTRYIQSYSAMAQDGLAESSNDIFRVTMMAREADIPLLLSEYAVCYWNRHRYEQAIGMGAFAAFQKLSGLTSFAVPILTYGNTGFMITFNTSNDPIVRCGDALVFCAFRRGDVKPFDTRVRLLIDRDAIYNEGRQADGVDQMLTRLALICGFTLDVVAPDEDWVRPREGEAVFALTGSEREDWPQVLPGGPELDGDKLLRELKRLGIVPADNPSSFAAEYFVSTTGELTVDAKAEQLKLSTPRLQAVASPAFAEPVKLGAVTVNEMSTRGHFYMAAMDDLQPLDEASRMLIGYATNGYNDQTKFGDGDFYELINLGKAGMLLETGKVSFTLTNPNAARFKLYALDLSGNRRNLIAPEKVSDFEVSYTIDTAALPDGPTLFFELDAGE